MCWVAASRSEGTRTCTATCWRAGPLAASCQPVQTSSPPLLSAGSWSTVKLTVASGDVTAHHVSAARRWNTSSSTAAREEARAEPDRRLLEAELVFSHLFLLILLARLEQTEYKCNTQLLSESPSWHAAAACVQTPGWKSQSLLSCARTEAERRGGAVHRSKSWSGFSRRLFHHSSGSHFLLILQEHTHFLI